MLADVTQTSRDCIEFAAVPTGWPRLIGLAVTVLACYAVVWLYRRENREGASVALRLTLACARCAVVLLLATIALRPVLVTYVERTRAARVAVLVDTSASMDITDVGQADTRRARIEALLGASDGAWIGRLAGNNETVVYDFAATARRRVEDTTAAPPDAGRTDLGLAITSAVEHAAGQPMAAIVAFTDGIVNQGMSADEIASLARVRKVPLYVVGVGDDTEPPNVRMTGLAGPSIARRGDPFEIRVDLDAGGVTSADLEVVLSESGPHERHLETRRVRFDAAQTPEPLRFRVDADSAGELAYAVSVTPFEQEVFADDNRRELVVRVLDEPLRVLLVAGRPSYEYRYITRLLERDRTVELSCLLQSADAQAVRDGDLGIDRLPEAPEELFAYDVVLLLDPDPAAITTDWPTNVRRFVDELGGGLLYQAGQHYAPRFLHDDRMRDLVRLLPVIPDPEADDRLGQLGTYRTRLGRLAVPDGAASHPLITLAADPATNAAIWAALPGVWWTYPTGRLKPLAVPLLQRAGEPDDVLFALQPVGAGRTAFMGIESTWRWRATAEPHFDRFWVQLVRYLAHARRQSASTRGAITLARDDVAVGRPLEIEARLLDEHFNPWHETQVIALIEMPGSDDQSVTLRAIPGRAGWYSGHFLPPRAGSGLIRISLPRAAPAEGQSDALVKHFRVRRPDIEMRALAMQAAALEQLATRGGGRFMSLAEAVDLPELIESAAETHVDRGRERDLWDNPWVLALLAALLGTEWTLRRRNQLL